MTNNERVELIAAVNKVIAPFCITEVHGADSKEAQLLYKDDVINLILNHIFEPTEGSTEDVKESELYGCPNWELMYNTKVREIEELQRQNELLHIQLERAWASLRTFEFVYGRKLNGIC